MTNLQEFMMENNFSAEEVVEAMENILSTDRIVEVMYNMLVVADIEVPTDIEEHYNLHCK